MKTQEKKDNKPDISVIIPAYNEQEYIQDCIKSVLNQESELTVEIIVCDDDSTDKTQKVLKLLERNESNLRVLQNEENKGIISTVNRLTTAASGDFLLRIDADSILLPGTLQAMYTEFNNGDELVFGRIDVNNIRHLHPTAAAIGKRRGRGTWYGGACFGVDRTEFLSTGGFKDSMIGAEVQELKQRAESHNWTVARLENHGVKSNFPVDIYPVFRRKFDSGRTHINQYIDSPEGYNIWELRGPLFWTIIIFLTISSIFVPYLSFVVVSLSLIPLYQYLVDARLAVEISGRKSFLVLYPAYQIIGAILRTLGVWTSIYKISILLRKKYLARHTP